MAHLYDGLVATRCNGAWHGQIDTTNKQMLVRSTHFARTDIRSIQLMHANSIVTSSVETGPGASATISSAIEYPEGVCNRIRYLGQNNGTILNNSTILSDPLLFDIPEDAPFWAWSLFRCPAGVIYTAADSNTPMMTGDQIKLAVSGLTDEMMMSGEPIVGGSTGIMYFPMGIIGPTSQPSGVIPGDSATYGTQAANSANGDRGALAPSIGPTFAYAKTAVPGERVGGYNSSSTNRRKLYDYATHVITNFGLNDIGADFVSYATFKTRVSAFAAAIPSGKKLFWCTLGPASTTVDGCSTLEGQNHTDPAWVGVLATIDNFNNDLRGAIYNPGAAYAGYFETSDVLSTARDSNFWKTTPQHSPDCGHWGTYACNTAMPASGAIDPSRIVVPPKGFLIRA